uniref:NADP-dependent oxidoreductase domain-containing protein n=2 Tax=Octactis speculum TaxID=3111310 RepID=A0A7S2FQQ0_9STRA
MHGAVLLRDFPIRSPEDFADVSEALGLESMDMGCSAAPRKNVVRDVVFTSNEAPPSEPIPFHHEMAQCAVAPHYVLFYCETPAARGGETPILLSEDVADFVTDRNPSFALDLQRYGVRYRRLMPEETDASSALGRSWKSTLGVLTQAEAEAKLREPDSGFSHWTWRSGGTLETITDAMPGIAKDPRTGRSLFFNSIIAAYTGWVDCRNKPKESVILGDPEGTPMDDAIMCDVAAFMATRRVCFPWQTGDILLIDNRVAMHSRESFLPPRRTLASLWGGRRNRHFSDHQRGGEGGACFVEANLRGDGDDGTTSLNETDMEEEMEEEISLQMRLPPPPSVSMSTDSGATIGGPVLRLHTGDGMPAVGLGLWKVPRSATAETVVKALRLGYRHLDCACDYGNEAEVGDGIQEAIVLGIIVSRSEIWVTSKLWNTYHAKEHVMAACKKTLSDLKLDYVDLYLVHFPIALKYVPIETCYPPGWIDDPHDPKSMTLSRVPMSETWGAMEALADKGLARNIGLCNVTTSGLRDVLSYAIVPPAVLQIERHVYLQQSQLVRMCHEAGIAVTGYSPLGSSSYVELSMASPHESALLEPTVLSVARKHGSTAAQVLLRWGLDTGASVIPKSVQACRLQENMQLGDGFMSNFPGKEGFRLDASDLEALKRLDRGRRFNDPGVFSEAMGCFCPIYD